MDELEEILYEYRLGFRGLPNYEELKRYTEWHSKELTEQYEFGYDKGYRDGKKDMRDAYECL